MTAEFYTDDDFKEVEIGPDVPLFTTGVICELLDIPVWVLKQLDAAGIVSPSRRTESSPRLYSKRELKKLHHCWQYLNKHKVKVTGLKIILQIQEGTFEGP